MKLFSIFFQKNRISYRFEFILSNILSKLLLIDVTVGLRMSKEDETLGADMTEHGIYDPTDTLVFGNKESVRVRRKISSIRKDTKDTNSRSYSKKGAINFGIVSIKKRITNENLEDEPCNGGTENNTKGTWKVLLENSFIDEHKK